jgi:hypothetical protein
MRRLVLSLNRYILAHFNRGIVPLKCQGGLSGALRWLLPGISERSGLNGSGLA